MARKSKVWYRASVKAWYTTIGGKQIKLASGKASKRVAEQAFHRLMSGEPISKDPGVLCSDIRDAFLMYASRHVKPVTVAGYRRFLDPFCELHGSLPVASLRPHHVQAWVDGQRWGRTTAFNAITAVKRAFSWASQMGLIDSSPIAGMRKPTPKARTATLTREQVRKCIEKITCKHFRNLITFLAETGARPSEALNLEARHIDWPRRVALMSSKTTSRTGRLRKILLTDHSIQILTALAAAHPKGLLFRNSEGMPWSPSALNSQVRRLRKKTGLGPELSMYAFRHTWITDLVARNVSTSIISELAGHTSTAMIDRYYNHIGDRLDDLHKALGHARLDNQNSVSDQEDVRRPEEGQDDPPRP